MIGKGLFLILSLVMDVRQRKECPPFIVNREGTGVQEPLYHPFLCWKWSGNE